MLAELGWLPAAPEDFGARLRALKRELQCDLKPGIYERVVALATHALDDVKLHKLAGLASQLADSGDAVGFTGVRLGLMGDGTLSLLAAPIVGSGLRHGLLIEVVEGHYSNAMHESADPASHMRTASLDFVLIACDSRMLGLNQAAMSKIEAEEKVTSAFERIRMIAEGMRPSVRSEVMVQTLPPPLDPLFGSFDRIHAGSPFAMVEALNRRIAEWTAEVGAVLVDAARLATSVGLEAWHDPGHWNASKLAFAPSLMPLYADVVTRTVAAVRGRTKKCLVLDLDNTLWGGVIGDDGLAGIKLGQGSATGEAFVAIQRMALELRARGVVLAVCSKNEEDTARLPFRDHPEMILREDNIAVFQANWTDKAANLKAIAEALNIGVDALVLLDDNPAERMQVRDALPLVGVPELPADPSLYPRALAAAGYFEAVAFSNEDRERANYYQANAQRAHALAASGDLDGYLASLNMVCTISRWDDISRTRVAQLINKSNQFNLTTRRYSEREVEVIVRDQGRHAIQIRLVDKFGDNGIISVILAIKTPDEWTIDTWLMSCRVLGRRVQDVALSHLVAAAKAEGAKYLIGHYIPTGKNRMVESHYENLGFHKVERDVAGTWWRLDVGACSLPSELPMTIHDNAIHRVSCGPGE